MYTHIHIHIHVYVCVHISLSHYIYIIYSTHVKLKASVPYVLPSDSPWTLTFQKDSELPERVFKYQKLLYTDLKSCD